MIIDLIATILCFIFGQCGGDACREMTHRENVHIVCSYDVDWIDVRLFLDGEDGRPYARLGALHDALRENDIAPLMLMNGGMYHADLIPVGLYVAEGKQRHSLSTRDGWGNFHLLPNGVFWGADGRLGVTETRAFAKRAPKVDFATQSGPMLVIDGKLHPRFLENSDSFKIRNGVGISQDGARVHFALSKRPVSFWDFGTLFRDRLGAHNALFLDGTVSAIRSVRYDESGWRALGPMIGVFRRGLK